LLKNPIIYHYKFLTVIFTIIFQKLKAMKRLHLTLVILLCNLTNIYSANPQKGLIEILRNELDREMTEFKKTNNPLYYLAFRVDEQESYILSSSLGSIIIKDTIKNRFFTSDLRIGDYTKDNKHKANNGEFSLNGRFNSAIIPLENNELAIAQAIWRITDPVYKSALDEYSQMGLSTSTDENDSLPDFTHEVPVNFLQSEIQQSIPDMAEWEGRLKEITSKFDRVNDIISGTAFFNLKNAKKYFVSNEETNISQSLSSCSLSIQASIRAVDGMICPLYISYFGFNTNELPSQDKMLADVDDLITRLQKLKNAPLAEPYQGPAILSSKAAGVFFHEIFGHRIEGHRIRQKTDSQTFKEKMDNAVLPKEFNVVFDPTLKTFGSFNLSGYYQFDDEGVRGQRVVVVNNGILKGFLLSRCPINTTSKSNGHGRGQYGAMPVSRQSNMIVSAAKSYSNQKLRQNLINSCKKLGKPYGYYFSEVSGGFTQTSRYSPNAFNITPLEVYRIYVDGRPDELVRGVSLIGTPLTMFSEIKLAGDQFDVFNGYCGAESGSLPVSTVAPALFVNKIETQKVIKTESTETILQRPVQTNFIKK